MSFLRGIFSLVMLACITNSTWAQVRDLEKSVESLAQDAAGYFQEELDRKAFHGRIALVDVEYTGNPQYADIMTGIADRLYHHLTRLQRVDGNEIYKVVERAKVEDVWAEQKASCGADRDEGCMIELGKNLSANRLVFVRVAKELDPRKDWHEAILTVVDATNGQRLMSYDADIHFDDRVAQTPTRKPQPTTTYTPPKDPKQWNSNLDLRIAGSYEDYFNSYRPSAMLDVAYRKNGHCIGVRLGFMPDVIKAAALPYDLGHVVALRSTGDEVVFFGSVPLSAGDVAMLTRENRPLSFDTAYGGNDGVTLIEFDRVRMTNIRAQRLSGHGLFRQYLSNGYDRRKHVKLFVDLALGWDWVRTSADLEVERTRIDLTGLPPLDLSYTTSTKTSRPATYEYDGYRKDLLFGTLMFGAGLEYGRLSISASWRTVWNTAFGGDYSGYRRVRGDILFMPMLNDQESGSDAVRVALEEDGAVSYGKANIRSDSKNKYTGNGVNRFTDRSNLMFTLAVRIL